MWINGFWRVSWDFIWINRLTNLSILFRLFWLYTLPLRHVSRPLQGLFCYIYTVYIDHPIGRLNFWIERMILCWWLMLFLTQGFMERLKANVCQSLPFHEFLNFRVDRVSRNYREGSIVADKLASFAVHAEMVAYQFWFLWSFSEWEILFTFSFKYFFLVF